MGLTMKERQAVTREMADGYRRATKRHKGEILDTLVTLTGYNRSVRGTGAAAASKTRRARSRGR